MFVHRALVAISARSAMEEWMAALEIDEVGHLYAETVGDAAQKVESDAYRAILDVPYVRLV